MTYAPNRTNLSPAVRTALEKQDRAEAAKKRRAAFKLITSRPPLDVPLGAETSLAELVANQPKRLTDRRLRSIGLPTSKGG